MKNKMTKRIPKLLVIFLLGFSLPLVTAFTYPKPNTVYRVYLKGESIGIIKSKNELEEYINEKIALRNEAKKNKDYALADSIRDELLSKNIVLKDTREGTKFEIRK